MRSTFSGLTTMVKGIIAHQISQETVGHNITSATSEGYSRQSVNLATTKAMEHTGSYGQVLVGTGVDTTSITRARDIYADRQYWSENSTKSYYNARQKQYDRIESIFNDTTNETIQSALQKFYESWQTLHDSASSSSARLSVINQGSNLADRIHTAAQELQNQINDDYTDITLSVTRVNQMLDQVVELNKNIYYTEATGAMANDLRDQRDLMVDKLTEYLNINVYENEKGMYLLVSNGVSLVNGVNRLTLEMTDPDPISGEEYGVNDYKIMIKESQIEFKPLSGSIRAQFDAIDECKEYIDDLANMASFLLSDFNEQHQQGCGIDTPRTAGINFFGDAATKYSWDSTNGVLVADKYSSELSTTTHTIKTNPNYDVDDPNYYYVEATVAGSGTPTTSNVKKIDAINALSVSTQITVAGGEALIAASSYGFTVGSDGKPTASSVISENGTGDGSNAVILSTLINLDMSKSPKYDKNATDPSVNEAKRAIGTVSLNEYYTHAMTGLGSKSETMDSKVIAQEEIMTQVTEWRESTSGVNWNQELTNMLMFQQGYMSCTRCLTTMDEMLDRLINNTGVVGR
jgi:flagellar hook-associated protein 1 FlgK